MEELYYRFEEHPELDPDEVSYVKDRVSEMYGPFHKRVIIHGVYFYEKRSPVMIYPAPYSQFSVAILLPEHQADNPTVRLRHLSHELVHCLTPNGPPGGQATFLEEGLAEHASIYLTEEHYQAEFPDFNFRQGTDDKYSIAFKLVEDLAHAEGLQQMRSGIRLIRANTGLPFAQIKATHLKQVFKNAPDTLLEALATRIAS